LSSSLGINVVKKTPDYVEVVRRTKETEIRCNISSGEKKEWNIDTGLHFFNHMIEQLAYFSEFNIDLSVKPSGYLLHHTIVEDSGITVGRAFYELAMVRGKESGIRGFGFSPGILDEACVQARVSFEGRVGNRIDRKVRAFGTVENVQEEFMASFFDGFAQGMMVTIQLDMVHAEDPHHLWECAFRSFGNSLRQVFEKDEWRKGGVAGIKGTVE
jgi:imidazoleglycerol-phosphate dehydratase